MDARLDRSWFRTLSGHESPALANLIAKWGLIDALAPPDNLNHTDMGEYYANTHTYTYTLRPGQEATARLDRWYVSAPLAEWVAAVEVPISGAKSDHSAVRLHLRSPTDPVRIRKPVKVYPPPQIAAEAVRTHITQRLTEYQETLQVGEPDAATWATGWDAFKMKLRKETLAIIKQRRKAARASYKQRIRRLLKQAKRLREAAENRTPTVESVTDSMDVLTLKPGTGGTPLQWVRNAITECTRNRAAVQQRWLFTAGGHRTGKSTKSMFARVSTKYAGNDIHRLDAAIGHAERGVHDKADTLADAWTPIFQQRGSTEEARGPVLEWLGQGNMHKPLLADLSKPFTEAEMAAAFGSSKRGKACGPDRFGNDWYRDFSDLLIPILTKLMNCWYAAGIFPPSFLEADIFCLKKGGDAKNPLNYRPLALLNTDYKLLTRMAATRTSAKLGAIVHQNQNGFVPYRTIHATIDLFTAAQTAANTDPSMAAALALLLDFQKAYDSVDRAFLYDVLRWLGFPPAYIAVIRSLHDGTKVRFLANGYRSRWVSVTCGIRQGCPLAPLLFLLVLEALYRRIDAEPRVQGILLKSQAGEVQLKVGGYADDTASYVRSVVEVAIIIAITRMFALASGLHLNEKKTLVIALNPDAVASSTGLPEPLKVQEATKLSRYLGIPVGSIPDDDYTWKLTRAQIATRLALAARKTMTPDQRSMVVMAVAVPKILFVGRHRWPSKTTVEAFQRMLKNFVWHASFTDATVAGRAWLNDHIAGLPRQQGGIAIPDLKAELLALAAVTMNAWALEADHPAQVVGDVLTAASSDEATVLVTVSPRHTEAPSRGKRYRPSMWTTGLQLCTVHGGVAFNPNKADMAVALHCLTYFRGPVGIYWRGRRLEVATAPLRGAVSECYRAAEAGLYGVFCTEWLPHLVLSAMRLYSETGAVVNPNTRFRKLAGNGIRLKDIVHWQWAINGNIVVTVLLQSVTTAVQRQVGHLMQLLLLNFPQLLTPGGHLAPIRYETTAVDHHRLHRHLTPVARDVRLQMVGSTQPAAPLIQDHRGLETAMQTEVGDRVHISSVHPHPLLARMVCLWAGHRRWKQTRKHYKAVLLKDKMAKGLMMRTKRLDKWSRLNEAAAAGLTALGWHRVRRVIGLNPWGEQLLLRVKLHALSTYNPVSAGLDCPHPECVHSGRVDLQHVFWDCPAAQALRAILIRRWGAAGLSLDNYETAIFSLTLPLLPQRMTIATGRILADLPETLVTEIDGQVEKMAGQCWSLGAALYLHAVWRWRVSHFDAQNDVTKNYHLATLKTRLRNGHRDVARNFEPTLHRPTMLQLGDCICQLLGADWEESEGQPVRLGHCYLVAVAGSVRGAPRTGYSSVVVARMHMATGALQIQYAWAGDFAGARLTVVQATQIGLLRGLRRCWTHKWGPIHVMADNEDMLRQHITRTPPTGKHLRGAYWATRRIADAVAVSSWRLQLREHNRAAHGLVRMTQTTGVGMEWMASEMPEAGARWSKIMDLLAQDAQQWAAAQHKSIPPGIVADAV